MKDEAAEGNKDMWRRDRMNAQTATLFGIQLRIPFGMNETVMCAQACSQQYRINLYAEI